jgi:hypothetical protein
MIENIMKIICITTAIIAGGYLLGRVFTKGVFKEIDLFLGKKYINYINSKKQKENDDKKE